MCLLQIKRYELNNKYLIMKTIRNQLRIANACPWFKVCCLFQTRHQST